MDIKSRVLRDKENKKAYEKNETFREVIDLIDAFKTEEETVEAMIRAIRGLSESLEDMFKDKWLNEVFKEIHKMNEIDIDN